jgi:hypothetical protein
MGIIFFDSFDHYTHHGGYVYEELAREYSLPNIEAYKNLTNGPKLFAGRNSSCALLLNGFYVPPTYTSNTFLDKSISVNIPNSGVVQLIIGCQIKKYKSGSPTLIGFKDNTGIHKGIKLSGNDLYITSRTSETYLTTISDDGNWHHLEVKIQISHPSQPWQIRIDGIDDYIISPEALFLEDINETLNRTFGIGQESTSTDHNDSGWLIDDLYLLDNLGASFNDFLGPLVRIETLFAFKDKTVNMIKKNTHPAIGAQSQDNIPHNETQYVYTNATNVSSLYEINNLQKIQVVGAIKPVILSATTNNYYNLYTWPNGESGHSCFRLIKDNIEFGPNYKSIGELNYEKSSGAIEKLGTLNSNIFSLNPSDNNPWDVVNINNLELGYISKDYSINITHVDAKLTQDLYFPAPDSSKMNSGYTAYLLVKKQSSVPTVNENEWDQIDSGIAGSIYYRVFKRTLNGNENNTMLVSTGNDASMLFITSSKITYDIPNGSEPDSNSAPFGNFEYTFGGTSEKCYTIRPLRIILGNGNNLNVTNTSAWTSVNGYNGNSTGNAFYYKNTEFTSINYDTGTSLYSDSMNVSGSSVFGVIKFNFLIGI